MERLGHLHPLMIHFPIGLLLVASFLNIYAHFANKDFDQVIHISLWLGFLFSLLACVSGWFLSNYTEQASNPLFWHQWSGIMTCLLSGIALRFQKWRLYFSFILIGIVSLTGHLGSVLTYGDNYFSLAQKKVVALLAPIQAKSLVLPREPQPVSSRSLAPPIVVPPRIDAPNPSLLQEFQARQISLVAHGDHGLSANFVMVKNDFSVVFRDFQKLAPWVTQLKLANQKNIDFSLMSQFTHVEDLDLSKTNLANADLIYIRTLNNLQRLNLHGTKVSDEGLASLMALKHLKKVYVWQSSLSSQALEKWKQANPGLVIENGNFSFAKPDTSKPLTR